MITTQYKCDLCDGDIHGNELNLKYKAKRNIVQFFSVKDTKDKIPISTRWKEIDVCENCLKEIIKRKQEKDKSEEDAVTRSVQTFLGLRNFFDFIKKIYYNNYRK